MKSLICWLPEIDSGDVALVGGKGASLGSLLHLGLPVPPGFVVTTEAYRAFLAVDGLVGTAEEELHARILAAALPAAVSAPILAAYQQMGAPAVAVRSSGTAEDLAAASFAGQHDTTLNVTGAQELLDAVRDCWASLWSPRAIDYRRQQGWNDQDLALAVVVQQMVPAAWAGVLFTADPVSGRRDRTVIEAVPGLGEALVSGQVAGTRYLLDKDSLRLLSGAPGLPDGVPVELARLGNQVEAAFGRPQDIEWAYVDGRTYLLQARPLTALPEGPPEAAKARAVHHTRSQRDMAASAMDHVPVPPYPFDYSFFFRPLMERMFAAGRALGVAMPPVDGVLVQVAPGLHQVIPPQVRLSPRALKLVVRLPGTLRARSEEWLAECLGTLVALAEQIDAEDLQTLSDQDLLGRIQALQHPLLALSVRRFVYFPRGLLVSAGLSRLLRLSYGRSAPEVERRLLVATPSVTTRANAALVRLAQKIRDSAESRSVFQQESPGSLAARLSGSSEWLAVRTEVETFLQRYGKRETIMPSVALPAWRDDPSLVYGLLKGLVAGEGAQVDPAVPEQACREVEAVLSRGRLGLNRRLLRPIFPRLLAATRAFIAFREDSHFYLFMAFPVVRRLALELGRRHVAAGVLAEADDIFFLEMEELTAAGPNSALLETVSQRKRARASGKWRTAVPAEFLAQEGAAGDFRGTAVSRGEAAGKVRVILSERDFWKLQKGEVLVAPYTNPTWTTLFALASAVVVDTGGAVSHAAIVAREYGIPAVMGVAGATTRLQDGQRVVVNGTEGRVMVMPKP